MKHFSERKALLIAIATSALTLLTTFGFADLMRSHQSASPPGPAAPAKLTGDAAAGRHLFAMNCAHCHGDDAHGDEGPDLYNLHKSDQRIHEVVTSGIKGEMPSFGRKLKDPDIRALTAYLRTLQS